MSKWSVNFFDLGAFDGAESAKFFEDMGDVGTSLNLRAILIEANPVLAEECSKRFHGSREAEVHNFAVSSTEGMLPFYLDDCGEGSSIYSTKTRLNGQVVHVPHRQFVPWMRQHGFFPKPERTVNVIKANIEGAEWDLLRGLEEHAAWGQFDIYCGPGFQLADMPKCSELARYLGAARELVAANIRKVYDYAVPTAAYPCEDQSVDLGSLVRSVMEGRE